MISVEPATASCVAKSLLAGRITSAKTSETIMTGLSCGTLSQLAWPYLSSGLDAATAVTDAEALAAVRDLHRAGVRSGPCAAAGLAAIRAITAANLGSQLGLGPESTVVLIGTEGFDANPVTL